MRILTVSAYFEDHGGGVEIVAGRIARELVALGHEVSWAACAGDLIPDHHQLKCVTLPCDNRIERATGTPVPLIGWRAMRILGQLMRTHDVLLVHDTLYTTSLAALWAAWRRSKPAVIAHHIGRPVAGSWSAASLFSLAERIVSRPALKMCSQAVYVSHEVERHFAFVRTRHPPTVVFSGVDLGIYHPATTQERRQHRDGFGFASDQRVALYVGRFVAAKGLEALRLLTAMRPDLTFAFAGAGPIDPAAWSLPNVRVFKGLKGRSLAALYQASDCLVLASPREGFSLVVREALACNLPVLCGNQTIATDPALGAVATGVDIRDDPQVVAARFADSLDAMFAAPRREDLHAFVAARYCWQSAGRAYEQALRTAVAADRSVPQLAAAAL